MEHVLSHTSVDHINGPNNGETVDLKSHELHHIMCVAGTSERQNISEAVKERNPITAKKD